MRSSNMWLPQKLTGSSSICSTSLCGSSRRELRCFASTLLTLLPLSREAELRELRTRRLFREVASGASGELARARLWAARCSTSS